MSFAQLFPLEFRRVYDYPLESKTHLAFRNDPKSNKVPQTYLYTSMKEYNYGFEWIFMLKTSRAKRIYVFVKFCACKLSSVCIVMFHNFKE